MAVVELEDRASLGRTGLNEKHLQHVRQNFHSFGAGAFIDKRRNNSKVLLTKSQREEVLSMLASSTPNDWGWPFWSTRILRSVIEERYGVVYSSRTSYYLLFEKPPPALPAWHNV